MTNLLRRLIREESGQDIIEYALVAAGIATLLIPTVPTIGQTLLAVYGRIQTAVTAIP
jgi:Flp pilus assembly pilin Flp